jgi:hypothetical protein
VIKASATVDQPENVPVTLTITMSLGEWKKLREQTGTQYPGWKLGELISEVVHGLEGIVTKTCGEGEK